MGPATIWDAVHLAGCELRMRVSGGASIIGVHAVTSCNGLYHAYLSASDPAVRLLILLQSVGWMGQFRIWAETRKDNVRPLSIEDLKPSATEVNSESALADVFKTDGSNLDDSFARVMRLTRTVEGRRAFLKTAMQITVGKADEVHYYKYLASLAEDIPLVSPEWQPYLSAAVTAKVRKTRSRSGRNERRQRLAHSHENIWNRCIVGDTAHFHPLFSAGDRGLHA